MSLVGTKKDKRWSKKNGITMHIPRAISFYPKTSIYYDIQIKIKSDGSGAFIKEEKDNSKWKCNYKGGTLSKQSL